MKTFLRILIIGAILLILVFLSIGIVRVVPKALSSLASATVSLGSFFNGSNSSTKTNTDANTNGANISNNTNATSTNDAGFIVSTSTNSTGANATTTSYSDLLKNKFGAYGPNSFIPKSGTNMSTYNTYGSASGANPSTSGNTGNASGAISSACANTGTSDIAVSIISKGIIDRTTGQFIETNTFSTNDTVSIKFKVENRGACATGAWNLRVQMPSTNSADQVRDFANNRSIPAGLAVTGQANFDSPTTVSPVFSVTVADNSGKDISSANNTASTALVVVNGTGGTGTGTGGVIVTGDGRADLAVRIVQIGTLGYNNVFIPQSNTSVFRPTDKVAVRFEVINQGKSASGPWTFRAEMTDAPNANKQYQNPQSEASIASGGKTTFTIGFDNIRTGNNSITIFADSLNQVNEFDENNNAGVANFFVSY